MSENRWDTTAICAKFTILVRLLHSPHAGESYRCIFVTNKELNMQGMGAEEQVIYSHVCKKIGMDLLCRIRLIMNVSCGPAQIPALESVGALSCLARSDRRTWTLLNLFASWPQLKEVSLFVRPNVYRSHIGANHYTRLPFIVLTKVTKDIRTCLKLNSV